MLPNSGWNMTRSYPQSKTKTINLPGMRESVDISLSLEPAAPYTGQIQQKDIFRWGQGSRKTHYCCWNKSWVSIREGCGHRELPGCCHSTDSVDLLSSNTWSLVLVTYWRKPAADRVLALSVKGVLFSCISVEPSSRKTSSSVGGDSAKTDHAFKPRVEIC